MERLRPPLEERHVLVRPEVHGLPRRPLCRPVAGRPRPRGRPIALLPASRHDSTLVSHGGLTYGGFVSGSEMTTRRMLDVFDNSLDVIREEGIDRLVYKCVPHIYHSVPAEEDSYALFMQHAQLVRRDISSVIDTRQPPPPGAAGWECCGERAAPDCALRQRKRSIGFGQCSKGICLPVTLRSQFTRLRRSPTSHTTFLRIFCSLFVPQARKFSPAASYTSAQTCATFSTTAFQPRVAD